MNFNLSFRPNSYFDDLTLEQKLRSKIKGQLRGESVISTIHEGFVPPQLLKSELSDTHKTAQEKIHPWMMGGEYLPKLYHNEVELCRVILKSATMDVSSLRVRQQKSRLVYRVVDEYSNTFILTQKTSVLPLPMGKVIKILDTTRTIFYDTGEEEEANIGLVKPNIIFWKEDGQDRSNVVDFVRVLSPFYPDLEDYYERQKRIWFDND